MDKTELDTKLAELDALVETQNQVGPVYREKRKEIEKTLTKSQYDAFNAEIEKMIANNGETDSTEPFLIDYAVYTKSCNQYRTLKNELGALLRHRAELAFDVAGEVRKKFPENYAWVAIVLAHEDTYLNGIYYFNHTLHAQNLQGSPVPVSQEVLEGTDEQFKAKVAEDLRAADTGEWTAPFNKSEAFEPRVEEVASKPTRRSVLDKLLGLNKPKTLGQIAVERLYM